jgi:glycerol-3-phosphate dehydrogenase
MVRWNSLAGFLGTSCGFLLKKGPRRPIETAGIIGMKRDLEKLTDKQFDLLVVGGGVHGAAIVREAALRGFKTALIEQGDFGQATSANSQKIIHGGLRYLQQADFNRMRQSITARRRFMQLAPHSVKPFPFLIPVYGHGLRGKEALAAALRINDLLSWDRNRSLPSDNLIPQGKVISREECLEILPHIEKKKLTGGAVWYDGLAFNSERLTFELIRQASDLDATVANYVRAKSLVIEKGIIQGVKAEDRISQASLMIRSHWVVNATGPWINSFLQNIPDAAPLPVHWTKGINLIINRLLFPGYGVGLGGGLAPKPSPSSSRKRQRLFFFVPWQGRTLVGVAYNRYHGDIEKCRIEPEEIQEFIDELNSIYPQGRLTFQDVSFFHWGLLPLSENQDAADRHPEPDRHSRLIDHEPLMQVKGLISVKTTKYTTAPMVAEKALNLISASLKKESPAARASKDLPFYNRDSLLDDLNRMGHESVEGNPEQIARHLFQNYGAQSRFIMAHIQKDRELAGFVSIDPLIMKAEIVHGIREEMALKLSDIVFRRTDLGQFRCPSLESLEMTAEIMARELGWDTQRTRQEIEDVVNVYTPIRRISC